MTERPIVVLGATGSIGGQTLEVADRLGLRVSGLGASRESPAFEALRSRYPHAAAVAAEDHGQAAVDDLARTDDAIVVNGIVGAVGLGASVAALQSGNRLALANKESLIAGSEVIEQARATSAAELIPVDSEHSAIFQLLNGLNDRHVDGLVITASGGPFRGRDRASLENATVEDALDHPTWTMGRRISVDSATLVNKGLEVIEAHALFGIPFDRIEVVVHPQSTVHSMVRLNDGSLIAHTGVADMRVPIQYAITHPERVDVPDTALSFDGLTLAFEYPDRDTFPSLDLAYRAGHLGTWACAAFNAADEVAVQNFIEERIGFLDITAVIEGVLDRIEPHPMSTVEEVMAADAEARRLAAGLIRT